MLSSGHEPPTEAMLFLSSMLQSIVFGYGRGALQAEVVGCESRDGPSVLRRRGLWDDGCRIEDSAEDQLVVCDGAVHDLLALSQEKLYML